MSDGDRRRDLLEAVLSAVLAAGVACLLFTNAERLLAELGWVALFWAPILALQWRLARGPLSGPGLPGRGIALAGFVIAALAAGLVTDTPGRLARHVAQFLVVWLPLPVLASAPRLVRRWRELLTLALSGGACVAVLALAGPMLMRRVIVPRYALDVDHRPRPNTGGTNEDGVYSRLSAADFRAEDFNVICLGDSFTANPHLPEADRWPSLLERLLQARASGVRVRVANFGWVSSSPVLQARRLRDIGAKYAPDLVVQAFDMTDFHDDLVARERLARMGADGRGEVSIFRAFRVGASLALGVEDYGAWLWERLRWARPETSPAVPGARYFFLFQPPEASEPYFGVSWGAILETERIARGMGARYALLVLPRYQQYDPRESPRDPERRTFPVDAEGFLVPFEYFAGQARTASFPVRSLREDFLADPAFPKCRDDDPHWNAEGNRVAAEAIARRLLADGLVRVGG
jgi:lysophospholipase L1-like esterase